LERVAAGCGALMFGLEFVAVVVVVVVVDDVSCGVTPSMAPIVLNNDGDDGAAAAGLPFDVAFGGRLLAITICDVVVLCLAANGAAQVLKFALLKKVFVVFFFFFFFLRVTEVTRFIKRATVRQSQCLLTFEEARGTKQTSTQASIKTAKQRQPG
jgi:hypothetical protein